MSRKFPERKIFCENHMCVFWEEGTCIMKEIDLDKFGRCRLCIYPEFPEEVMRMKREEFLIADKTREPEMWDKLMHNYEFKYIK